MEKNGLKMHAGYGRLKTQVLFWLYRGTAGTDRLIQLPISWFRKTGWSRKFLEVVDKTHVSKTYDLILQTCLGS